MKKKLNIKLCLKIVLYIGTIMGSLIYYKNKISNEPDIDKLINDMTIKMKTVQ